MEHQFDPKDKKILLVSAHPDDADFFAGGTIYSWIAQGAKAAIVIATNGDKGTSDRNITSVDLADTRHQEQLEASQVLGIEKTWFLDYPDAHLEVTQELKEKLVRIIREYKPDAVFTFDPTMIYAKNINYINHPDHVAIGQATLHSLFPMARDFLIFPEHSKAGLEPHNVTDVFLYNNEIADYYIDISSYFEKKLALLGVHKSQFDVGEMREMLHKVNGYWGEKMEVSYAEAFIHLKVR